MQIQNHPHKKELIDALEKIDVLLTISPDYRLPSLAFHYINENVKVKFDDVQRPYVPDTFERLLHHVRRLLEKYADDERNDAKSFVNRLQDLLQRLRPEDGSVCGESLYYSWFYENRSNPYNEEDVRRDMHHVLRDLRSASIGYNITGTYDNATKTITLFTQNIGNDPIAYISTFAHEFFHAAHHFLLDQFGHGEPLTKYYHTVVMETLATRFQIDFLQWLDAQGNADADAEVKRLLQTITRYSPIFFPYSGAKYAYTQRYGQTPPTISQAIETSCCESFEDVLRALIPDKYEVEIILRMEKSASVDSDVCYRRHGPLSPHAPTTFAPADVINGTAIYFLPHNVNVFRGMVEERHPFGV